MGKSGFSHTPIIGELVLIFCISTHAVAGGSTAFEAPSIPQLPPLLCLKEITAKAQSCNPVFKRLDDAAQKLKQASAADKAAAQNEYDQADDHAKKLAFELSAEYLACLKDSAAAVKYQNDSIDKYLARKGDKFSAASGATIRNVTAAGGTPDDDKLFEAKKFMVIAKNHYDACMKAAGDLSIADSTDALDKQVSAKCGMATSPEAASTPYRSQIGNALQQTTDVTIGERDILKSTGTACKTAKNSAQQLDDTSLASAEKANIFKTQFEKNPIKACFDEACRTVQDTSRGAAYVMGIRSPKVEAAASPGSNTDIFGGDASFVRNSPGSRKLVDEGLSYAPAQNLGSGIAEPASGIQSVSAPAAPTNAAKARGRDLLDDVNKKFGQ